MKIQIVKKGSIAKPAASARGSWTSPRRGGSVAKPGGICPWMVDVPEASKR